MVYTQLQSPDVCGDNHSAATMYYTLDPVQNNPQYTIGNVGTYGGVGLFTPSEVINVSSFLHNYDDVITKDIPDVNKKCVNNFAKHCDYNNLKTDKNNSDNIINDNGVIYTPDTFLLPEYTREKGVAKDLSAVNWQTENPHLHTNHQDLTHVIFRGALQQGGFDSNQLIKQTWNNKPTNQVAPSLKLRHPYWNEQSKNIGFDAKDIASVGGTTPVLEQNVNLPFNKEAMFINGGCNLYSDLKCDNMLKNF